MSRDRSAIAIPDDLDFLTEALHRDAEADRTYRPLASIAHKDSVSSHLASLADLTEHDDRSSKCSTLTLENISFLRGLSAGQVLCKNFAGAKETLQILELMCDCDKDLFWLLLMAECEIHLNGGRIYAERFFGVLVQTDVIDLDQLIEWAMNTVSPSGRVCTLLLSCAIVRIRKLDENNYGDYVNNVLREFAIIAGQVSHDVMRLNEENKCNLMNYCLETIYSIRQEIRIGGNEGEVYCDYAEALCYLGAGDLRKCLKAIVAGIDALIAVSGQSRPYGYEVYGYLIQCTMQLNFESGFYELGERAVAHTNYAFERATDIRGGETVRKSLIARTKSLSTAARKRKYELLFEKQKAGTWV